MRTEATRSQIGEQICQAATGTDAVMISFQQTMQLMTNNFLQAQQQIMLEYLHSKAALNQRNAECLHIPLQQQAPIQPEVSNNKSRLETKVLEQSVEPAADATAAAQVGNAPHLKADEPSKIEPSKGTDELISSFIELVSERTGYPAEMLDPALDLESDLGIDSIKRVEILSNFRRLLPEELQEKFEGDLEELGTLRTLQAISDWIRKIPIPVQN